MIHWVRKGCGAGGKPSEISMTEKRSAFLLPQLSCSHHQVCEDTRLKQIRSTGISLKSCAGLPQAEVGTEHARYGWSLTPGDKSVAQCAENALYRPTVNVEVSAIQVT